MIKKIASLSEIAILVLSFFAFAFLLQQSLVLVSAKDSTAPADTSISPPPEQEIPSGFVRITPKEVNFGEKSKWGIKKIIAIKSGRHPQFIADDRKIYNINSLPKIQLLKSENVLTRNSDGTYGPNPDIIAESPPPSALGSSLKAIGSNFLISLSVYGMVNMLGGMVFKDKKQANSAAMAAGLGTFVGTNLYSLTAEKRLLSSWAPNGKILGMSRGTASFAIGAAVAIAIFLLTYKKEKLKVVNFQCEPWQPPLGGERCEQCNKDADKPCSEYRCKSLGAACELVNSEQEGKQLCVWVNRNDAKFPTIKPWKEALSPDHEYRPDSAISPPDYGVRIINKKSTDGCVRPFTPLGFGIETDEPAQCRIDYAQRSKLDEMQFSFGDNLFAYNHSLIMSLPGPNASESGNPVIGGDGTITLYTKCRDKNGNENTANFIFRFCLEKGPDTTPPMIVTTSILNNMPVAYNQDKIALEVYVNEPAECRWSRNDLSYDDMENAMSCSTNVFEMNAQSLYRCSTELTGIENSKENNFFFRCKDQPGAEESQRNKMQQSYKFTLLGTQPLSILDVSPNGTIRGSTDIVKVELKVRTDDGYQEGKAVCSYTDKKNAKADDFIEFYETNSYIHTQELDLSEGSYTYYIKCIDLGGNQDTAEIRFNVEVDKTPPIVVRAYHEGTKLKIITNEDAKCVYDRTDCNYNFEDGINMPSTDKRAHLTDWSTNSVYYIKCQDEYGTLPHPNDCNIIVSPYEIES